MWRSLEELPSTSNGLSRAEQQLLDAVAKGHFTFNDVFRYATEQEDRIYCGDSSAASYLERLSRGNEPLVVYRWGERVRAPQTESERQDFREVPLVLTDAGEDVLACRRDWISMGGSDRWVGGVHLDGSNARWRFDGRLRQVIDREAA